MKHLLLVVAPLALVACGAPAAPEPKEPPPIVEAPRRAPEPAKPAPPPASAPAPRPSTPAAPTVIDLGGTPAPAAEPAPAPSAPAEVKPDAAAVAASDRLERERREQRVRDAEAKIAELEKRRLAISNPYLPRPQLPPEEAEAWEGLDGVQRRARVDKQLEAARAELDAAQAALKALGGS